MIQQRIIDTNIFEEYKKILKDKNLSRVLVVCGKTVSQNLLVQSFLNDLNTAVVFQNFKSNPDYESAVDGVKVFKTNRCDCILAIGGGSAMDVAKCIKAFVKMPEADLYLKYQIETNKIPFFAIPTTAGTGSEATKFAVIYYQGEKQSVEHEDLIPDVVFFESKFLHMLSTNQKKAPILDTLCHGIESFWSVNANEESRCYAKQSIRLVLEYYKKYILNDEDACQQMHKAAYLAGKAINISKTTAAHALCYKLTTLYGIPHGQAAAICLKYVWKSTSAQAKIENNIELQKILLELVNEFQGNCEEQAIQLFEKILDELEINCRVNGKESDINILVKSVNIDRLKNHPVQYSEKNIKDMYYQILNLT